MGYKYFPGLSQLKCRTNPTVPRVAQKPVKVLSFLLCFFRSQQLTENVIRIIFVSVALQITQGQQSRPLIL